jgi:hypothetical protein
MIMTLISYTYIDTKAINIIYRSYTVKSYYTNSWYFYETPVGTSALCKSADQTIAKFDTVGGFQEPLWPNGIFPIKTDGMDCEYKNNDEGAGALWCQGRTEPIQCHQEVDRKAKFCLDTVLQTPYVYCEWS